MSTEAIKWYSCKIQIGRWFLVHFTLKLCLIVYFLIAAWLYESVWLLVIVLLMIPPDLFFLSMFMSCSYGLDDAHLFIRQGFLRARKPLNDISEMFTSSKSNKLVMIYSRFKQKMEIASPQDLNGFFDDLAKRPGFQRSGDRVVKRELIQLPESKTFSSSIIS